MPFVGALDPVGVFALPPVLKGFALLLSEANVVYGLTEAAGNPKPAVLVFAFVTAPEAPFPTVETVPFNALDVLETAPEPVFVTVEVLFVNALEVEVAGPYDELRFSVVDPVPPALNWARGPLFGRLDAGAPRSLSPYPLIQSP